MLRVPAEQIRVIHVEGAGGYGHNGADDVALDAALAARAVPGRPVLMKWTSSVVSATGSRAFRARLCGVLMARRTSSPASE